MFMCQHMHCIRKIHKTDINVSRDILDSLRTSPPGQVQGWNVLEPFWTSADSHTLQTVLAHQYSNIAWITPNGTYRHSLKTFCLNTFILQTWIYQSKSWHWHWYFNKTPHSLRSHYTANHLPYSLLTCWFRSVLYTHVNRDVRLECLCHAQLVHLHQKTLLWSCIWANQEELLDKYQLQYKTP